MYTISKQIFLLLSYLFLRSLLSFSYFLLPSFLPSILPSTVSPFSLIFDRFPQVCIPYHSFVFFAFPMLSAPNSSLSLCVLLSLSQYRYMLYILSHQVAVIRSLSSVFYLRRITVKSKSLKRMLKKLRQRPSQLVHLLKRYVHVFSEFPPHYDTSFTLHSNITASPNSYFFPPCHYFATESCCQETGQTT